MPLIQWNDAFSVNIKGMDAQHQKLIEIINRLHEAMRAGKGSQDISSIVDQMVEYTQYHFEQEEKLLASQQYPGYLRQKAEHQAFIHQANAFKQSAAQGKLGLSVPVSNYLKEWLTNHIQGEDKKYGRFLNARGVE